MIKLRQHWLAAVILCLFLLLGVAYSVVDPIFEASDELTHYPFVQYLAQGHGLPVQRPGEQTLWMQEGSQPPLYYALGAALTFWIDTRDLPGLLYLNPHAARGVPLAPDNKNMIIHTAREGFPWQGTTLAVHLARLFSVLLGAGTVLCTYLIARTLFPDQPAIAYGAMAINAFIPMFLFISGSVNNDTLVTFLSCLALLLLVRVLVHGVTRARLVVLGFVIGLACLSKLGGLGLLPLTALALGWHRLFRPVPDARGRPPSWQSRVCAWLVDCLAFGLPAVAVAGWWYARNLWLYGDLTGLNVMLQIGKARRVPVTPLKLWREFEGFRINFWGLFGGVNILMQPAWVYRVLDVLTAVAVVALLIWGVLTSRRRQFRQWPALAVLVLWIFIVLVALIRWTTMTSASQGRLMYPALSAICLVFALGLAGWLPRRYQAPVLAAFAGFLLILAVAAPVTAIVPAYERPVALPNMAAIPAGARPVNIDYGSEARLLAYEISPAELRLGDTARVTLYWQALAPLARDYSVFVQLLNQGEMLGQRDSYPGGGSYPTSLWSPGEILRDEHYVTVVRGAGRPVLASLAVGLYDLETMNRPAAKNADGAALELPVLAHIKVSEPVRRVAPPHALDANLAGKARLIGYDPGTGRLAAGGQLPLTLYWQVDKPLGRDYTVFVHLVGAAGQTLGQGDGPPLGGSYPTSAWGPGEVLPDLHQVTAQSGIPAGRYRLYAGLYDRESGERLPVLDAQGQTIGDRVLVTEVEVSAGS